MVKKYACSEVKIGLRPRSEFARKRKIHTTVN